MARTATVWMVHARTGLNGLKGKLSLEGSSLVFHPETTRTGDTVVGLEEITSVKRVRGSPVMEVRIQSSRIPPLVGFYFVQPPDLTERFEAGLNPFKRQFARKTALRKLRLGHTLKKDEIEGWVRTIEEARRR
jgi:hypothetical protein